MRISTVREFRDHATGLMQAADPLLVTRRGRLAGVFIPWTADTLPVEWKRELFLALSADIGRQLKRSHTSENAVMKDFDEWKRKRRADRGGR